LGLKKYRDLSKNYNCKL